MYDSVCSDVFMCGFILAKIFSLTYVMSAIAMGRAKMMDEKLKLFDKNWSVYCWSSLFGMEVYAVYGECKLYPLTYLRG